MHTTYTQVLFTSVFTIYNKIHWKILIKLPWNLLEMVPMFNYRWQAGIWALKSFSLFTKGSSHKGPCPWSIFKKHSRFPAHWITLILARKMKLLWHTIQDPKHRMQHTLLHVPWLCHVTVTRVPRARGTVTNWISQGWWCDERLCVFLIYRQCC